MIDLADFENLKWKDIKKRADRDELFLANVISLMAIIAIILSFCARNYHEAILAVTILLTYFNISVKASSNKDIKWYEITDFDQILGTISLLMSGLIFFAFRDIKPLVSLAFFGTIQAIIQIRNYNIRAKKLGIIWFDTRSSHEKKIICKKLLCVIIDQVPPSDRAIVYELDGAYHYRNIEKTAYHHYVSREGYRTIVEWSLTQQRLKFKNTTITIDPNNPNLSKNIGEFRIFMSLFNDLYEHFYTYESDRRKVIQHAATIFDAKTTKYIEHLVNGYDYDLAFGEAYGTFDVSKTK